MINLIKRYVSFGNILSVGVFIFLTGMFYFPSWQSYKNAVHLGLFLPGLLIFVLDVDFRRFFLKNHLLIPLVILLFWACLSVLWSQSGSFIKEIKHISYVLMFFIGILAAEYSKPGIVKLLLVRSVPIAAISALYALYHFYIAQGYPYTDRLHGYELLVHPILSTFVYGFYAVVGLSSLADTQKKWPETVIVSLSVISLCFFVIATQTRGTLLALGAALFLTCLLNRNRFVVLTSLLVAAGLFVFVINHVDMFFGRGMSRRPELWLEGLEMSLNHLWMGVGVAHEMQVVTDTQFVQDHPHNMFINIFLRLGLIGLLLWLAFIAGTVKALLTAKYEEKCLGLTLILFSLIVVMFDGDGPFVKPRAVWFVSWLPLAIGLCWAKVVHAPSCTKPAVGFKVKET